MHLCLQLPGSLLTKEGHFQSKLRIASGRAREKIQVRATSGWQFKVVFIAVSVTGTGVLGVAGGACVPAERVQ